MASFTPGPWRVGQEYIGGVPVYVPGDVHFCTVYRANDSYANAHLISAAPELYTELANLAAIVANELPQYDQAVNRAMAALAKARGESVSSESDIPKTMGGGG